jgi:hypothetical protein
MKKSIYKRKQLIMTPSEYIKKKFPDLFYLEKINTSTAIQLMGLYHNAKNKEKSNGHN